MYHMVSEHKRGARFNKLRVKPGEFEKQIHWLKKQGFQFVFASELATKKKFANHTVCLTFDDGYADNLAAVDPVLESYGAKATLYLVEDRSGGWSSKKKAHHEDDELQREPKLSDDQVRSMLASGRWELGGHTTTHANLSSLNDEQAFEEIVRAKKTFENSFGTEPMTFAYPFGIYSSRDINLVGKAGYLAAMTTESGIESPDKWNLQKLARVKASGKDSLFSFKIRIRTGKRGFAK